MSERKLGRKTRTKKPKFIRIESWRYMRLDEAWRAPKGIDNKTLRGRKGWPKKPSIGYRAEKSLRNLHPSGSREIVVENLKDIERLKELGIVGRISANVGRRKRREITDRAKELGVVLLNPLRERALESESTPLGG